MDDKKKHQFRKIAEINKDKKKRKEISRKGGIMAGVARRRKRAIKEICSKIMMEKVNVDELVKNNKYFASIKKRYPGLLLNDEVSMEDLMHLSAVVKAIKGNPFFYKEVNERLDGKVEENINIDQTNKNYTLKIIKVENNGTKTK